MKKKDYTFHILGLIIGVISLLVTIISYNSAHNEKSEYRLVFSKSKVAEFREIIDTLDRYDYIPYAHGLMAYEEKYPQKNNLNGFTNDTSKYARDSVQFYNARTVFFYQKREMLYWLLDFRNDTLPTAAPNIRIQLEDGSFGKLPPRLWTPYFSPLLSVTRQLKSSNSLDAISLIHSYLNGPDESIHYTKCSGDSKCLDRNYDFVEAFLKHYHDVDIETLRDRWQFWEDIRRLLSKYFLFKHL